jgi:hypothetical protein
MQTLAYYDNSNVAVRPSLTLELLPDEVLELRAASQIEFVDGPVGHAPTVADGLIILHEIGRYWFKLTNASGERQDLRLLCFEPAVLAFTSTQVRGVGHGDSEMRTPSSSKIRSVVKSLANHADFFDGKLASLTTGEPSRSLAPHGC